MADKCTFGVRPAIDINMLNEVIYRELKFFKNYKTYRPDFSSVPVAAKFYAAHDAHSDLPEEQEKINSYHYNVAQARVKGPHSKYPGPVTENMCYGWYHTPLVKMDRNDKRFYHPQQESTSTKIEVIIRMSNPKNRK